MSKFWGTITGDSRVSLDIAPTATYWSVLVGDAEGWIATVVSPSSSISPSVSPSASVSPSISPSSSVSASVSPSSSVSASVSPSASISASISPSASVSPSSSVSASVSPSASVSASVSPSASVSASVSPSSSVSQSNSPSPSPAPSAILAKQGTFAQPGATGNQSITGIGFQPKLVLFWMSGRTTDGSDNGGALGWGAAVDTTHRFWSGGAVNDNVTTYTTRRRTTYSACIGCVDVGSATVLSEADLVSYDWDGFTLNWTIADATNRVVCFLALGGADLTNVALGTYKTPTVGNYSVTGVGFQPDSLITCFNGTTATLPDVNTSVYRLAFGAALSSSVRAATGSKLSNETTSYARQLTSKAGTTLTTTGSGVGSEADFVSFDADGFTLDYTTVGQANTNAFWIALKGARVALGTLTQPTGTGSQNISTPGVAPRALILASFGQAASASTVSPARMGFGIGTGSSNRSALSQVATSGVNPNRSNIDLDRTKVFKSLTAGSTPTVDAAADLVSLDNESFTLDWTTVDATAREIVYLAIGDTPVSPSSSVSPSVSPSASESPSSSVSPSASVSPSSSVSASVSPSSSVSSSESPSSSVSASVSPSASKSPSSSESSSESPSSSVSESISPSSSVSPSASDSPSSSVSASKSPSASLSPSASISPSESIHQFAYPISDLVTGVWTPSTFGANLYSMINEPLVANDTNYISAPLCDGRLAVQLRQGTTLIAERILTPDTMETFVIALTTEERNLVTNWSNLSIWLDVYVVDQIVKCALGPMNPPHPGTVYLYVRARKVIP